MDIKHLSNKRSKNMDTDLDLPYDKYGEWVDEPSLPHGGVWMPYDDMGGADGLPCD